MITFFRIIGSGLMALALGSSQSSHAAEFVPQKPVRFIVPALAGASNDIAARALAGELTKRFHQRGFVGIFDLLHGKADGFQPAFNQGRIIDRIAEGGQRLAGIRALYKHRTRHSAQRNELHCIYRNRRCHHDRHHLRPHHRRTTGSGEKGQLR